MLKTIKNYFKRRVEEKEKKLIDWIANTDIKLEKYKFFYGDFAKQYMEVISYIDLRIAGFILSGGKLIYAYAPDVYNQIKQCNKSKQKFCFTENKDETKLNDLIFWNNTYPCLSDSIFYKHEFPLDIHKNEKFIDFYFNRLCGDVDIFYYASPSIEEDVQKCIDNNQLYIITIQKDLIKKYRNITYD